MIGTEIAEKIASNYGIKPKRIVVKMVGAEDIRKLLKLIEQAQKDAHKNPIKLT